MSLKKTGYLKLFLLGAPCCITVMQSSPVLAMRERDEDLQITKILRESAIETHNSTIDSFENLYYAAVALASELNEQEALTRLEVLSNKFMPKAIKIDSKTEAAKINRKLESLDEMLQLKSTMQSIFDYLEAKNQAQTQVQTQKQSGARCQSSSPCSRRSTPPSRVAPACRQVPVATTSLTDQIIHTHRIELHKLPRNTSTQLLNSNREIIGYIRPFSNGVVIELKGLSQQHNMDCGFATYANAHILQSTTEYAKLFKSLRSEQLLEKLSHELNEKIVNQLSIILGSRETAQQELNAMIHQGGLGLDNLYQIYASEHICLGADDAHNFNMFATEHDAQRLLRSKKQNYLNYSFYKNIKQINPAAHVQKFQLPLVCAVVTGDDVENIGHWVAVRFEHMSNGQVGIILVDSCPFAREGNRIEAIDKIEAYKKVFSNWFERMGNFLK